MNWSPGLGTLRVVYLLFLGQLVSFSLALESFTSSLAAASDIDVPLLLMLSPYMVLALAFGSILLYRRQKVLVPWYWYFLLGFVDVQANFLVNTAYEYTSVTSVILFQCWKIAWVLLLTWFFLRTRYSLWQLFGSLLCILGPGFVLLSNVGIGGEGGSKPLLADVLVIGATIFYALSNVGEEFFVKERDCFEVVSMMSLNGALVCAVEIFIFERSSLGSINWSTDVILAFVGFAVAMFAFHSLNPVVLMMSGAAMFNLSLLTSNMWAVVVRIFFYHQEVDWLYYLAFSIVIIGLVIYSSMEMGDGTKCCII